VPGAFLIEASARFTRPELERYDREGLLIEVIVERSTNAADDDALADSIRERVGTLVSARLEGVVAFVDVTVLPGPSSVEPPAPPAHETGPPN
jgi:hypothetical protein